MGFPLTFIGLMLVVTAYRGTYAQFGSLVAGEFTGKPSFLVFVIAVMALGSLGYIPAFQRISRLLLLLVLIGIIVSNKGFFANFTAALKQGPVPPATPAASSANPSGQGFVSSSPLLDLGPLGSINPQIDPNGPAGKFLGLFGWKGQ